MVSDTSHLQPDGTTFPPVLPDPPPPPGYVSPLVGADLGDEEQAEATEDPSPG